MDLTEKTINQSYVFSGKIINVRVDDALLPNGHTAKREVIEHPGGVCVAALNEKNELLFVRQFRYPYGEVLLEIPAGKLDKGEDPLHCGIRELKEETGAIASEYIFLGQLYPSPGYCGEIIYMYFARIESSGDSCPDEDEFLECEAIHIEKAVEMILANEIKDAKTQTAVLKVYAMLKSQNIL